MRVTIIADDSAVYVDGHALTVDLTGLDPDCHAIQWDGASGVGEMEYRYHFAENTKRQNERFTDFAPYQAFVDRWTAAKAALTAPSTVAASTGAVRVIAD